MELNMTGRPISNIGAVLILSAACLLVGAPSVSARQYSGLWSTDGKMLLPIEYDEIRREGDKFIARKSSTNENGATTISQIDIELSGKQLSKPYSVPEPAPYQVKTEPKFPIPAGWSFESNSDFGCIVKNEKNQRAFVDADRKLIVFPSDYNVEPIGSGLFLKHTYPDAGGEVLELVGPDMKTSGVLPPNLNTMNSKFKDGLLRVRTESGVIAFINTKGEFQIKPTTINDAEEFYDGKCKVKMITRNGDAAAIIDKNGNVVAGPFEKAEFPFIFKNGDQVVVEFEQERAGVVTTSGKQIIPFEYDFILEYGDKYVGRKDQEWSIFAHDGKTIRTFPPSICNIEPCGNLWRFSEGGDASKLKNTFRGNPYPGSKCGLMDDSGNVVIPASYDGIMGDIKNGLVLITGSSEGKFGYGVLNVNTKNVVMEPRFQILSIQDGFILAYEDRSEFDPRVWKDGHGSASGWADFLATYDLIGMKKVKVEALLGRPLNVPQSGTINLMNRKNFASTYMTSSGCTGWTGIEIEYDLDDLATGWRDVSGHFGVPSGPWHRINVVLVQKDGIGTPLVVPKKEAKDYASKL